MNNIQIKEAADFLAKASRTLEPMDALTKIYSDITVDDAYKIQLENINKKVADGRTIIGKKIGLTSHAMQEMLGVPEPDYGHLLDDMLGDEEVPIKVSSLLQPKIEPELAFILKDELKGPGITVANVIEATAGVMPALEIIDSRIKDWKIMDLRHIGLVLEKNGQIIDTAAGAAVLGNPAIAVAWLANKLAQYDISLKPGEIILAGSLTKAYEIEAGDLFTATFDKLGTVKVLFK